MVSDTPTIGGELAAARDLISALRAVDRGHMNRIDDLKTRVADLTHENFMLRGEMRALTNGLGITALQAENERLREENERLRAESIAYRKDALEVFRVLAAQNEEMIDVQEENERLRAENERLREES